MSAHPPLAPPIAAYSPNMPPCLGRTRSGPTVITKELELAHLPLWVRGDIPQLGEDNQQLGRHGRENGGLRCTGASSSSSGTGKGAVTRGRPVGGTFDMESAVSITPETGLAEGRGKETLGNKILEATLTIGHSARRIVLLSLPMQSDHTDAGDAGRGGEQPGIALLPQSNLYNVRRIPKLLSPTVGRRSFGRIGHTSAAKAMGHGVAQFISLSVRHTISIPRHPLALRPLSEPHPEAKLSVTARNSHKPVVLELRMAGIGGWGQKRTSQLNQKQRDFRFQPGMGVGWSERPDQMTGHQMEKKCRLKLDALPPESPHPKATRVPSLSGGGMGTCGLSFFRDIFPAFYDVSVAFVE
ncbi:hypothetical protein BDK51DRAFT_51925 [Blyttiomyces helicus]|uniref:Uncharacterized protein n=1 Tax=Blyttiomyces helicus TaxID=388810 RepID=A0A4P9WAB7_9FUNG|nr:hypothetical protein BDK51DRAFT_51925 [Blyttiomyces helicus]|eukprot:RKO89531.1 hypothetical protein BDK51DRAFT_51925 [Blyttiomyces helicus]